MKSDEHLLIDMLRAAFWMRRFTNGVSREAFMQNEEKKAAVVPMFEVMGEAAAHVSDETSSRLPAIPWPRVVGMRHRLIHAYDSIDYFVVWDALTHSVPAVIEILSRHLGLNERDVLQ